MTYYIKDNTLYAVDTPITDDSFTEITKDEYDVRVSQATENRE